MRFISSNRGLEIALRNPKITGFTQTGDPIYDGNYLKAEFQQGGVSPWEAELAIKTLLFKGMYEGEDPTERLSWFDTETAQLHYGWTDDEREFAEKRLLEIEDNFMLVEQPKVPAPWHNYDTITDPKRIVALIEDTGTSASEVLAYERENKNRIAVIDAVEALSAAPTVAGAVVVNA